MNKRQNAVEAKSIKAINNTDEIIAELQKDIKQLQQSIKDMQGRKEAYIELYNRELQQAYKSLDRKQELIIRLKG
jgi:hypothetical protein